MRTILAVLVLCLLVLAAYAQDVPEQWKQQVREEMHSTWEVALGERATDWDSGDEERCWQLFCDVFCAPEGLPETTHPDLERLRTLLPKPTPTGGPVEKLRTLLGREPKPTRTGGRWANYVDALNKWGTHAGIEEPSISSIDGREASQLLHRIVGALDYRSWLEGQMKSDSEFRKTMWTGANTVDKQWRDRALAFCRSDNSRTWEKEYAEAMFKLLNAWGVAEVTQNDVETRPWFVIHCFFAFLNRERFQGNTGKSPYDEFVARLPLANALAEVDYALTSPTEVDVAQTALLRALHGEPVGRIDMHSSLARIGEACDYLAWRDAYSRKLATQRDATSDDGEYRRLNERWLRFQERDREVSEIPEVNEFVQRFARSETP